MNPNQTKIVIMAIWATVVVTVIAVFLVQFSHHQQVTVDIKAPGVNLSLEGQGESPPKDSGIEVEDLKAGNNVIIYDCGNGIKGKKIEAKTGNVDVNHTSDCTKAK